MPRGRRRQCSWRCSAGGVRPEWVPCPARAGRPVPGARPAGLRWPGGPEGVRAVPVVPGGRTGHLAHWALGARRKGEDEGRVSESDVRLADERWAVDGGTPVREGRAADGFPRGRAWSAPKSGPRSSKSSKRRSLSRVSGMAPPGKVVAFERALCRRRQLATPSRSRRARRRSKWPWPGWVSARATKVVLPALNFISSPEAVLRLGPFRSTPSGRRLRARPRRLRARRIHAGDTGGDAPTRARGGLPDRRRAGGGPAPGLARPGERRLELRREVRRPRRRHLRRRRHLLAAERQADHGRRGRGGGDRRPAGVRAGRPLSRPRQLPGAGIPETLATEEARAPTRRAMVRLRRPCGPPALEPFVGRPSE